MPSTDKVFNPDETHRPVLIETSATITRKVPLSLLIEPPDAMRHDMDDAAMSELMDSIREVGLLQDLCVTPVIPDEGRSQDKPSYASSWNPICDSKFMRLIVAPPFTANLDAHERAGGLYMVRAGHRRLCACRGLNLNAASCKVFCSGDVSEKAIMAHENAFREEPSDFDLAVMYREWMTEPGITEDTIRRRSGKSIDFVYARVELLNGWKQVADALHERKIKYSVARELNKETDEPYMLHFLNMAVDQGATGKLVRAWVQEHELTKTMAVPAGPAPPAAISVTAPMQTKVECCVCGDTQSYNLRTVMMCHADAQRIAEIRQAADAQPDDGEVIP